MSLLNGAAKEYQTRFGEAPGSSEVVTEGQRWEQLCQELVHERDRLRSELTTTQADCKELRRSLTKLLPIDDETKRLAELPLEELLAMSDKNQSLAEFLAELGRSADSHG